MHKEKVGNKQRITAGDRGLQGADQDQEVPSTSAYPVWNREAIARHLKTPQTDQSEHSFFNKKQIKTKKRKENT